MINRKLPKYNVTATLQVCLLLHPSYFSEFRAFVTCFNTMVGDGYMLVTIGVNDCFMLSISPGIWKALRYLARLVDIIFAFVVYPK